MCSLGGEFWSWRLKSPTSLRIHRLRNINVCTESDSGNQSCNFDLFQPGPKQQTKWLTFSILNKRIIVITWALKIHFGLASVSTQSEVSYHGEGHLSSHLFSAQLWSLDARREKREREQKKKKTIHASLFFVPICKQGMPPILSSLLHPSSSSCSPAFVSL